MQMRSFRHIVRLLMFLLAAFQRVKNVKPII